MDSHKEELQDVVFNFTPQPVAVSELPTFTEPSASTILDQIIFDYGQPHNPWRIVTNNFAQTHILDFLRCYHSIDDQRVLLERIKESSKTSERMEMEGFYTETLELIEMGEYLPRAIEQPDPSVSKPSELSIAYQQIEALKLQIEDIHQSYTAKFNEQRADYERRLSRIESQYQAELKANQDRIQKTAETPKPICEPSFTITEIVAHASSQCIRQGADAISAMLYRLAGIHGISDAKIYEQIDSITHAIDLREARRQTMEFPNVSQFNNNPNAVNNNFGAASTPLVENS